jgi:hypothetical protein
LGKSQLLFFMMLVFACFAQADETPYQVEITAPAPYKTLPASLQGSLIFSGHWDVDAAEQLNGNISLRREAGDLSMTASDVVRKPLRLETLKADISSTIRPLLRPK